MTRTTRKLVKFVLKLLVVTSFIVLIGSFGAYEADNISLLRMFVQITLATFAMFVFAKLEDNI